MFGYILPDKPELKVKEYEMFRAYYCGVCKSMGRSFGLLSRLSLNYDTVFLALFLSSLHGESPEIKRETCIANPIGKKHIVRRSPYVDYAADINVLLTYYKLKDNWNDEKNMASLIGSGIFRWGYEKAAARNRGADLIIRESVSLLSELEKSGCSSLDAAAEPFAGMMKKLLKEGYRGTDAGVVRTLEWIGYNIGKWVYTIDAFDDIEKDIKSGSYNPVLRQYGFAGEAPADFKRRVREEIGFGLYHALSQSANAVELLSIRNKGIIDNIVYNGLQKKTESILGKYEDIKCIKEFP